MKSKRKKFWRGDNNDAQEDALELLLTSDAMLMGRWTYEIFAGGWPARTSDYADLMNSIRKYVFSSQRRFHHRSGVLAPRMLSLMIALILACALSSAVNAGDGGNSPKSGADSPDSAGLVDRYLEIEKTKLHLIQGGTGRQTVVMLHGNPGDIQDFEYGL